jgi:DNA topoisomerase-1
MTKHLVIVESPTKCSTISKYLGSEYSVLSSYGHIRQFIQRKSAVEVDNNFKVHFQVLNRHNKYLKSLREGIKEAHCIYLATDCDREGEGIAWHIMEYFAKELVDKTVYRITFNEITKNAIVKSIAEPRTLNMNLVQAYHTRSVLDFLVGFYLSPVLWKKVAKGLSAGRVQGPSLRIIANREKEIRNHIPQEYFEILVQHDSLELKILLLDQEEYTPLLYTQKKAEYFVEKLNQEASALVVESIKSKEISLNPKPPFTTSTLQQKALQVLNFNTAKTMLIAQQLYEGIKINNEQIGLISYMRTDSVTLSSEFKEEMKKYITEHYEVNDYYDHLFNNQLNRSQEAHEAIRPTIFLADNILKQFLSEDQYKLYILILQRTLSSHMSSRKNNVTTILLTSLNKKHQFTITTSDPIRLGWSKVYEKKLEEKKNYQFIIGQQVVGFSFQTEQNFTKAKPFINEGSLIKELTKLGIGRPSTYTSIITTLKKRKYVEYENGHFLITSLGNSVANFLEEYFPKYVDYNFTAILEEELDQIAYGTKNMINSLNNFWTDFYANVNYVNETAVKYQKKLDISCIKCGMFMVEKTGRFGNFIACSAYPECKYIQSTAPETIERDCPECRKQLVISKGRFGKFIACSGYPKCRYKEQLNKKEKEN